MGTRTSRGVEEVYRLAHILAELDPDRLDMFRALMAETVAAHVEHAREIDDAYATHGRRDPRLDQSADA
mgnify:FL=1